MRRDILRGGIRHIPGLHRGPAATAQSVASRPGATPHGQVVERERIDVALSTLRSRQDTQEPVAFLYTHHRGEPGSMLNTHRLATFISCFAVVMGLTLPGHAGSGTDSPPTVDPDGQPYDHAQAMAELDAYRAHDAIREHSTLHKPTDEQSEVACRIH